MTFVQNFVLLLLCAASLEAGSCKNNNNSKLKYKRAVEVPTAVTSPPATSTINADTSTTARKLVCYLDFENQPESGTSIKDKSENGGNNGFRERGLLLVNFQGCGNAAYLYCGDILFHGDTFQGKPYTGITIAAWVRILDLPGSHSIFDTIGSSHECGQYHFEVNDGSVRWFHRNETQGTVFSVEAPGGVVKQGTWVHIAGTYDGAIGKAKIYVNGDLKNMSVNEYGGFLSRDWNMRVGIGDHKNFRPVLGFVDEFRIYNYAVTKKEITDMVNKCKFNVGKTGVVGAVTPPPVVGAAAPVVGAVAPPAVAPAVTAPVARPFADTHDAVLINDEKESSDDKAKPSNQEMEETILKRSNVFSKHRKPRKH